MLIAWRQTRSILLGVLPTVASFWQVWLVFAVLLGWTALLVTVAYRFHFWTTGLIKDTVIWCGSSALVLFFSVTRVAREPHFFRNAALAAFKATVFVEFYVNLYVFPFLLELILQPVVTLLALSNVVPGDPRVKALANRLLSVFGLAVVAFATVKLIQNSQQKDWLDELRRLILPIWLTLGVLPCLHEISLVFNYQRAFRLLRWASHDPIAVRRARLALVTGLHLRTRLVGRFDGGWAAQLTGVPSFREARRVVREYKASMAPQG